MGHGGLREETSTNRACIPRSRLHTSCIDRPPPPRSLEINPFLSAIAHWKDVCIVDPSVIDSRSPSRHITPHTTCETSKPTLGNTITVLANNSLYRRHLSISFGIHAAALFTASMLWLPSFPHYEGVMVAHRQPTFRCAQIHLKGTSKNTNSRFQTNKTLAVRSHFRIRSHFSGNPVLSKHRHRDHIKLTNEFKA